MLECAVVKNSTDTWCANERFRKLAGVRPSIPKEGKKDTNKRKKPNNSTNKRKNKETQIGLCGPELIWFSKKGKERNWYNVWGVHS